MIDGKLEKESPKAIRLQWVCLNGNFLSLAGNDLDDLFPV